MPSISVRKLDEETLSLLRIQAAHHGVSMEAEVREILIRGIHAPERLGDLAVSLFSPTYSTNEFELPEREIHKPIAFK